MPAFVHNDVLERPTMAVLDNDPTRVLPARKAALYRLGEMRGGLSRPEDPKSPSRVRLRQLEALDETPRVGCGKSRFEDIARTIPKLSFHLLQFSRMELNSSTPALVKPTLSAAPDEEAALVDPVIASTGNIRNFSGTTGASWRGAKKAFPANAQSRDPIAATWLEPNLGSR
jgi:hypothetical protein